MKPAMAARPVATTMEIQDIWPLDTVSHVLFLLPVCRWKGEAAMGGLLRRGGWRAGCVTNGSACVCKEWQCRAAGCG